MNLAFLRAPARVRTSPAASAAGPSSARGRGAALSQTARAASAFFQLGSLASPAVIAPFYVPREFAALDAAALGLIQAMGFANLATAAQLRRGRAAPRDAAVLNAVSMIATAALYVAVPVKPLAVNAPYVASLLLAGTVSLLDLRRAPAASAPAASASAPAASASASAPAEAPAAAAARQGGRLIPAVYLAQVALSAGCWAWADERPAARTRRPLRADVVDAALLLGAAACSGLYCAPVGAGLGVAAANCLLRRLGGRRGAGKDEGDDEGERDV